MNAIVAGKVEKPEGSLVFKTIAEDNFLGRQLTKKDFDENYLKIITVQNQTIIFPLHSLSITSDNKTGTKVVNPNIGKYLSFYHTGSTDYRILVGGTAASITEVITSIKLGTLE